MSSPEILLSKMTKNEMASALARVLAKCDEWDVYTKGESGTTRAIRTAIRGDSSD